MSGFSRAIVDCGVLWKANYSKTNISQIPIRSLNARTFLNEFCELLGAPWVNKLHLHLHFFIYIYTVLLCLVVNKNVFYLLLAILFVDIPPLTINTVTHAILIYKVWCVTCALCYDTADQHNDTFAKILQDF